MRAAREAAVPEAVRGALEQLLRERIGHVQVIEHSWFARLHGACATTRLQRIYLAGSAAHPDGRTRTLEGVRALGWLEPTALGDWMARAAIYAHPARYEPFGLGVLEAALSGCALVLGDIPSLRELWEGAALFVEPDDEDQILFALRSLVRDGRARRAMGERARARAASFTPARMAAGYLDLYGELCRAEVGEPCA